MVDNVKPEPPRFVMRLAPTDQIQPLGFWRSGGYVVDQARMWQGRDHLGTPLSALVMGVMLSEDAPFSKDSHRSLEAVTGKGLDIGASGNLLANGMPSPEQFERWMEAVRILLMRDLEIVHRVAALMLQGQDRSDPSEKVMRVAIFGAVRELVAATLAEAAG